MPRLLHFFILLNFYSLGFTQFQANYWYFGNLNGIHFTNGFAEVKRDGLLKTTEGCASISDSLGKLLFYTNGKVLYGNNQQIISNQLVGNPEAAQSSIFVPYPGYSDSIFLFVNGAYGLGGIHYYLLSASQQSILTGPILLHQPTCEKITAVHQANQKDFWLLTHEWNSNKFVCYSITEQGISNPIISAVGTLHAGTSVIASGTMKFSLQGDQVACAIPYLNLVERFDFANGVLSNPRQKSLSNPYGVSFSPDGQLLYATGYYFAVGGDLVNQVYQWNNQNQWVVVGSWICPLFTPEIWIGDISNAIDGKMYISQKNAQALGVIEYPNQPGTACNFQYNGFSTPNQLVEYGLPNFVQSFLKVPKLNFQIPSQVCATDSFQICITSYLSGSYEFVIENQSFISTSNCIRYAFVQPGQYTITLKQHGYSVTKTIKVYGKPKNPFSQNTMYACKGEWVTLDAQNDGASYFWSNGFSSQTIKVNRTGNYNVKIYFGEGFCPEIFSVRVEMLDIPMNDFKDTLVCNSSAITYYNPFTDAVAIWNGSWVSDSFQVKNNGIYTVQWIRGGACEWRDTFQVTISPPWIRSLPYDTVFCPIKGSIILDAGPAENYRWSTQEATQQIEVLVPGIYSVLRIDKNGCSTYEEINVKSECNLIFMPNAFTPNEDGLNEVLKPVSAEIMEYEMYVFNNEGKLIFSGLEWNGKDASEGVYTVLVDGQWKNGKKFKEVYTVTLIR